VIESFWKNARGGRLRHRTVPLFPRDCDRLNRKECVMSGKTDKLKAEMLEKMRNGGAWFRTRKDNYLKIEFIPSDNCYYARECVIMPADRSSGNSIENRPGITGGAYTFGTDWFDIHFHGFGGKWLDIYVDPDTLRSWEVVYDDEGGISFEPMQSAIDGAENSAGDPGLPPSKLKEFCIQADHEALAGLSDTYHLDGAAFARFLAPSEERMGKLEDIIPLIGNDE